MAENYGRRLTRVRPGVPAPSSEEASHRMRATRQRNTQAELDLQAALDHLGLRYTVDQSPLPELRRRADLLFEPERVAVFVDGCFWHGCPLHGSWPKAHAQWWREKILANRSRDADTDRRLAEAGWKVIRVWSHEMPSTAAERIAVLIRSRNRGPLG
jgi:DNA mismatch endonuclease (patch repair protein)